MTALETKADAEALINKEGIEYVSVRFTDLIGVQQHFTVPASEFLKDEIGRASCRERVSSPV